MRPKTFSIILSLVLWCSGALPVLSAVEGVLSGPPHAALEGPGSGLVGWWKFDEGSGTVAVDSSGNGNDGTLINFSSDNSQWVVGQLGQALKFKASAGQRAVVATSTSLDFGTGSFTVAFWMMPAGSQNSMPIAKSMQGYDNPGFNFFLGSNNTFYFASQDGVHTTGHTAQPGTDITSFTSSWNHYVGVWDSGTKTATLYVNGMQAASQIGSLIGNVNNNYEFTIGARSTGAYNFNGAIDDVRVYNRVLSPQEIALLCSSGANQSFVVENLGSPLQGNTQEHQVMYKTSDGHRHLQMYYDTFGAFPMNIVDIDVDNGTVYSKVFENNFGRPGPQCHVYYPGNNKVYVSGGDPGHFSEFDPSTGNTRYVHALRYKGGQYGEVGNDGWIYIGEVTSAVAKGAGVERYNPLTDTWQDLGVLDPAFTGSLQYAYTLGADSRYLYVGLGELPWYLAVYDTQASTNPVTLYWADQADTAGSVLKGVDGKWYYQRYNSNLSPSRKTYKLESGVPVETSVYPAFLPSYYHGNTVDDKSAFGTYFNTQINLDNAYPNSANSNTAVIGWQTDSNPWQFATINNLFIVPIVIKRLYAIPGDTNNLLGWADDYGVVFKYNVNDGSLKQLGYPQRSPYDAVFDGSTVYLSGYASCTLRYDMSMPWTLSGSSNINSPSVNPYLLALGGGDSGGNWNGKYDYYNDKGSDGKIYIAAHHERDSTGGGLGWYDPATGASDGLRQPFLNYDVRDLLAVNNGTKVVYSSLQGPDPEGKLFVLDVATKQIERIITPIPGVGHLDKIIEAEPGVVIGITTDTSYKVYKVNILTGEIVWVKDLGGTAFPGIRSYDRRLVKGPDGYAWLFIDNNLSRINPVDATIQKIMAAPVSNIMFNGSDLYFYGGTALSRIKNILASVAILYGDVDGNGDVSAYDAALTARHAVGYTDADFKNAAAADVDNIPGISAYDAALIAQRAVGLISKFPVEP